MAAKSLSAFVVGVMSKDKVALINETTEAFEYATITTTKEYNDVNKIVAEMPTDTCEFIHLLNKFSKPVFCIIS